MPLVVPAAAGGAQDPVPLGSTSLGTAAASSSVVSWGLALGDFKWLDIYACVSGYASGGGIFSLQFGIAGGAIDTGARYRWLVHPHPTSSSATQLASVASSTTTAATSIQLANAAITTGRVAFFRIMNRSGSTQHTAEWTCINEATSAIAHPTNMIGNGSYISASAGQITSVQMITNSGGGNLNAGSGFKVYGVPA